MGAIWYLATFVLMGTCYGAFFLQGPWVWAPVVLVFGIVPILETLPFLSRDVNNPTDERTLGQSTIFSDLLNAAVIFQCGLIGMLLIEASRSQNLLQLSGLIISTGLACGVYGINVGHELGHRADSFSQRMARLSLATSLYAHFFVEHNLGHHRNVATELDPASSRRGEWLYTFWIRSIVMGYISAWKISAKRTRDRGHAFISIHNTMLVDQTLQAVFLVGIALFLGTLPLLAFLLSALIGILLLETVNYIEHYGLSRQRTGDRYERVRPQHSWNSNHIIGRLFLFNLPRHSDHHAWASRNNQILRHFDDSPQLPAGYPAMLMLAVLPPLWIPIMNARVDSLDHVVS